MHKATNYYKLKDYTTVKNIKTVRVLIKVKLI